MALISLSALFALSQPGSSTANKMEIDTAVNQAKLIYKSEKERGRDFSSGPCLSNALMPEWVVDIAHSPRLPIDDLPENQCPAYREGKAKHFVELDPDGNCAFVTTVACRV